MNSTVEREGEEEKDGGRERGALLREDGGGMQSIMRPGKKNSFESLMGDVTQAG